MTMILSTFQRQWLNWSLGLWMVCGCVASSHAQVITSYAPNVQGMYYYSVDTLIDILQSKRPFSKITLSGHAEALESFPSVISQVNVAIPENSKRIKTWGLAQKDIVFTLTPLNIDRDHVRLTIRTAEWNGRGFSLFEQGAYTFTFQYQPGARYYRLESIKGGG